MIRRPSRPGNTTCPAAATAHAGANRNLGVALATHDLIVFLDSDCRASPDLFARYERGMRDASPEVAAMARPTFVERAPGCAGGGAVPGANGHPLVPVARTANLAAIQDVIWAPAVAGTGRVLG